MKKLSRPFDVLERHLTLRAYVLVQRFTVADLNIAAVMTLGAVRRTQPRRMAAHEGWLHECLFRPTSGDADVLTASTSCAAARRDHGRTPK